MAEGKLTKTVIESVEPGDRDFYLWDTALPGFGVKITPKGARIYLVQYRPKTGRMTRRYTLGRHGAPWTAENARKSAGEVLARVRLGEDPFDDERKLREARAAADRAEAQAQQAAAMAERRESERAKQEAFPRVVADFVERYAKPKNKRWDEAQRVLNSDDLEPWRDRTISNITRRDVMTLIDTVEQRSHGAARLLFAHLRRFFNWCVERLYLEVSPVNGLKGPTLYKARDRVLSDDELRLVWRASDRLPRPFGPFVRLLILTGQRRGEVAGMRWSEIDLVSQQWVMSSDRTKNGQAHAVDLSDLAISTLTELSDCVEECTGQDKVKESDQAAEKSDLVFTTTLSTSISGFAKIKLRLDELVVALKALESRKQLAFTPWRLHDLRRTAATGMARLGYAPHVVEAVLNHRSGVRGGLVAVYQHYDHRPERKAALRAWSEHVARLVADDR